MSARVKRWRMRWAVRFCVAIFAVTAAIAQPPTEAPSGAAQGVGPGMTTSGGDGIDPRGAGTKPFDYVITESDKNLPDLFGWDKNRVATIGERTNPRTTPPDIGPGTGEPIDKFMKCVEAYMALGLSREVAQAKCKG
jgi:hypothetical protein